MDYQNNYYQQTPPPYGMSMEQKLSTVMKQVYLKMFFGLLVTAVVSFFVAMAGQPFILYLAQHSWAYWGLAIFEIGLVMWISSRINRLSPTAATGLFYLFAVVNGLTLSMIFVVYTAASLFKTFLITAGTFGAMSVYGYFTSRNLASMGAFLRMALWGLIICLVVNLIWPSNTLGWIISFAGVAIFVGLTAWDTQQIRNIAEQNPAATDGRLATIGALTLYLDFINLFLYLLRFFGSSRD